MVTYNLHKVKIFLKIISKVMVPVKAPKLDTIKTKVKPIPKLDIDKDYIRKRLIHLHNRVTNIGDNPKTEQLAHRIEKLKKTVTNL